MREEVIRRGGGKLLGVVEGGAIRRGEGRRPLGVVRKAVLRGGEED